MQGELCRIASLEFPWFSKTLGCCVEVALARLAIVALQRNSRTIEVRPIRLFRLPVVRRIHPVANVLFLDLLEVV